MANKGRDIKDMSDIKDMQQRSRQPRVGLKKDRPETGVWRPEEDKKQRRGAEGAEERRGDW